MSSGSGQTEYLSLEQESEGYFEDRGSRFLAFAFPVRNEMEITECLQELRELHPKSRHHGYAYRLGLNGNNYRVNDDGEPSGTAGKPILGQIDSAEITQVLIVVIRYFGGVKLGTGGLIKAYRAAARDCIEKALIISRLLVQECLIKSSIVDSPKIEQLIKRFNARVENRDYAEHFHVRFQVDLDRVDIMAAAIEDLRLSASLELLEIKM